MSYDGFAATRPRDTGYSPEALQHNRRVELFVKARKNARIDIDGLSSNQWTASTTLEIFPYKWDTLMTATAPTNESKLTDIWEILVVIENQGPVAALETIVIDSIPNGTTYVDGTAMLDGKPVNLERASDGSYRAKIGTLESGRNMKLQYRIKALPGQYPLGKYRALSITQDREKKRIETHSNSIEFK
jgi:uncharacterized repeat protein (TIGR01451 family)